MPNRTSTTMSMRLLAAGAMLLIARVAAAAPPDLSGEAFQQAIANLDSPDWTTRIAAADLLRSARGVGEELESTMHSPLTAEQQQQLMAILEDRILLREAGAIGIQMDRAFMAANIIVVDQLFTNMPAEKVLVRGDRITHINGREILNISEFREELRRHAPGESVRITVARPREELEGGGNAIVAQDDVNGGGAEPGEGEANPALPDAAVARLFPPQGLEVLTFEIELGPAENLGDEHLQTVWQEKLRDVAEVRRRYTLRSTELLAPTWRSHVDTHPRIAELLGQIEIYDRLPAPEKQALIQRWKEIDEELYREYVEGSADERALRRDVLSRFRELLPRGATFDW